MKKLSIFIFFITIALANYGQSLEDGLAMMRYQRYQSAGDIFSTIAKANPLDTNALYWQGQALLMQKEFPKAVDFYKSATIGKKSFLLTAGMAQAYTAAGKKALGLSILTGLNITPENTSSVVLSAALARVYTEMKEFVRAGKYIQKAAVLAPDNPQVLVQAGTNALRKGDGSAAYTYFTNAKSLDSNYLPAYYSLAKLFISQKNTDLYLPLLKKVLNKDSMYAPAWYEMYRYAYYHDKDNVKKYYAKFLDVSDKTDQQEVQLLVMDYNAKKYAAVIDRAGRLFKDEDAQLSPELYRYVAFSYYKTHHVDDAYKNMVQYMQTQDSLKVSSYDRYLIAQLAVRQKVKDSTTLSYITDAYEKDTSLVNKKFYAMSIVNHYVVSGDKYAATAWREKLLPLKGMNKVDMYRIGVAWYEFNELDKAEKLFIQFNNLYPDEFKGIYMQAGIKAKVDSNMTAGVAVPYFEEFVHKAGTNLTTEYKPMLEQSYNYLGAYYLTQKDYTKALAYYNVLLKYQPKSADLKKTVAGLKKYIKEMKEYKSQAKNNKQLQQEADNKN
ncbi:MAG: tetratricopeptide repeat protein [Sediminibacterium sp.]